MDLFHTVPSVLLSSQEIYHKSDECPPTPAGRHCRNDLSVQYVQTGACCTGREKKTITIKQQHAQKSFIQLMTEVMILQ